VRVDDNGMYHFVGRANEMVKVKGSFVAPSRVEQALKSIDGISAAAVILQPAPNDAVRVVAHVQVDDETLTPERVDAELRERLPAELLPAIVMRHDELPSTPRMKLDRRALENGPLVRWRSTPARGHRGDYEWWCLAHARRIIGLDDVGPDDDLFEAGLDSLGALELGAVLAGAGFGDFDPPRLLEARSVAGIARMLTSARTLNGSTVVVLNDGGRRPRLFALPGGGGTALEYRSLADALGPDQPLAVIEPRGMHSPDPVDRTVEDRAGHVVEEIEARLGPDEPCVLLGFSGGGPPAYEASQRFHAKGRRVHLVLLDSAVDAKRRRDAKASVADEEPAVHGPPGIRSASATELPGAVVRSVRNRWRARQFARLVRDPGPPSFEPDRYLAFQRIHSAANLAYEPAPATFPATLVQVAGGNALTGCSLLMPDLVLREVGGNHKTMLVPPHVDELAAIVAAVAEEALAPTPARHAH
jgi:thioesterase domain-containing protein